MSVVCACVSICLYVCDVCACLCVLSGGLVYGEGKEWMQAVTLCML